VQVVTAHDDGAVHLPGGDAHPLQDAAADVDLPNKDRNDPKSGLPALIIHQALEGSFSAVSTPILATKYSFCRN